MLSEIITLLCIGQAILALPHPDHHPAVVYDADEHRLYFDFPPEIFIGNGNAPPCPAFGPVTAPCKCGDSVMCTIGQSCVPTPSQGPAIASGMCVAMPPACEIAESFKIQVTGGVCTCGSQVCSFDQYCDRTETCVQSGPVCPPTLPLAMTPCKCGFGNTICLGTATMCSMATGMCT